MDTPDFTAVFEKLPRPYLVIDAHFVIVAQNDAHAAVTMMKKGSAIGRQLFEVYPDNPEHYSADGVSYLRASILSVIKTRHADEMAMQKYDVQRSWAQGGGFETRYWRVVNIPILDDKGFVKWILNCPEDVTASKA
ncbi:MAG: PAS domain-containing protein [Rhizomicrobium sp.]